MKLFQNLLGKDNGIEIGSPVAGRLVSIKEVNDPTFSEEILGKGAAVIPSDNRICSPIDGKVTTMFPTGHAAAVTGDNGAAVLIHVGLDTVNLKGEYFTIHAADGQDVKKGMYIVRFIHIRRISRRLRKRAMTSLRRLSSVIRMIFPRFRWRNPVT